MFKKNKKAFSLVETLLVLAVMLVFVVYKIQAVQQENMDYMGKTVAQQIKTVSDATNAYIVMKYGDISSFKNSEISCNTGTNTCTIPISVLKSNYLLKPNFSEKTIFGQPYEIQIKRQGTSPSYMIGGIVLTKGNGTYDSNLTSQIMGRALRNLGVDGGVVKTAGKISGLSGNWSATSSDYPILSGKTNYIGNAVGSLSGAYYAYLRRDGTLPMTGNLNMGGQDINNATNITASNTITSGHEVIAHNGYGDQIAFGGDAAGNDYEIRLGNGARPLTLYSPSAAAYTTVLNINRNTKIEQRLGLMGRDPNDLPSNWGGGLRTLDVYADGTVGAGTNQQVNAYLNSSGDVYASRNITGNYIKSNGNVDVGNQVNAVYVWASGNLNSNYIHSNGNIDANGSVNAGYVHSNGNIDASARINAGEYVHIDGQAGLGNSCSPNGLVGRDGSGQLLYCKDGSWRNSAGTARQCNGNGCYMTMPDGTMLQWGRIENNQGGNTPITFPTSFPNECSNVSITATNHSLSGNAKNVPYVNLNSISRSSVWVSNGQGAASGIMWYAIGY